ncbi:MAG: hypothetical protein ACLUSP_09535 [Christensenellales bacterium]
MIKIDGKYYCVYHGRDGVTNEKGIENRTARVCELVADNGTLTAKDTRTKFNRRIRRISTGRADLPVFHGSDRCIMRKNTERA